MEAEGHTSSSRDNEWTVVVKAKRRAQREPERASQSQGRNPNGIAFKLCKLDLPATMKQVRTQAVLLASPQEVVIKH